MRIQNLSAMAKGERDLDNVVLSLRLRGAEAARFWNLMDKAKSRNAYIDRSDVLRELLKLNPPTVLTEKEILFFRTGTKDTETRATFHNAEQVEFPQKKLKVSDDRRDESKVSKPRKRGGQR